MYFTMPGVLFNFQAFDEVSPGQTLDTAFQTESE
jgi:hypothetical protein